MESLDASSNLPDCIGEFKNEIFLYLGKHNLVPPWFHSTNHLLQAQVSRCIAAWVLTCGASGYLPFANTDKAGSCRISSCIYYPE